MRGLFERKWRGFVFAVGYNFKCVEVAANITITKNEQNIRVDLLFCGLYLGHIS